MGYIPHNVIIDDAMKCQFTNYGFDEPALRNLLTSTSAPLVKILHDELPNTENISTPYEVEAEIYSGGNLIPGSIAVYYNLDGSSTFNTVNLVHAAGNTFTGLIPAQSTGSTVYYYIHAEADNGKQSNLPLNAPTDLSTFEVLIDTVPPVISHTAIETWLAEFWPAEIVAEVTDTLELQSVVLEYMVNGGSMMTSNMTQGAGNTWTGVFGGTVAQDDVVSYRIRAVDSAAAQNEAVMPVTGWYEMNIAEMVDALVLDLDGNANSGTVLRDALLGLGLETHYLTDLPALPELYQSIFLCLGVAPNNYSLTSAEDEALYNFLTAGRSLYIEGGNFWKDDPRGNLYFEFGIGTTGTGEGDAGAMTGQAGSLAAGLSFTYSGDNNSIDRLKTKAAGVAVLKNTSPEYLTMVSQDSGTYSTIAASVEFGGLQGDTTALLTNIADFFGLQASQQPTPTPTAGACTSLGVDIEMPSNDFGAGDIVNTIVTICNPDTATYLETPIFVILDVFGDLFFYPSFNEFDYQKMDVVPGETAIIVLPDFQWPDGVGAADGILWYAGMTNPEMTDLMGDFDSFAFGWH